MAGFMSSLATFSRLLVLQKHSPLCFQNNLVTLCSLPSSSLAARHISSTVPDRGNGTRSAGLNVFDRKAKYLHRKRAALRDDAHLYQYLKDEVGYRLSDRIFDIKKEFQVGLDLGCGRGNLSKHLTDVSVKTLYMADMCEELLSTAELPEQSDLLTVHKKVIDEEQPLPFDHKSLDVVLSNLNLHWVNNLPLCLREVHRCLKPGGVFLASMFGGDTLFELRSSLLLADMERQGGISAHVSPFTEVQDIGGLLTHAGFDTLTIDTEDISIGYPSMFELIWDLKGMAENNANVNRKLNLSRDALMAAAAIYEEMYGLDEGGIPATYQIIYLIGWKPDPSSIAKPAERGSGEISFKDLSKLEAMVKEKGMEGRIEYLEELTDPTKKK